MAQVATGLEVVDLVGHYRDGNIYSLDILVRLGHGECPHQPGACDHQVVETSTNSLDYTMNSTSRDEVRSQAGVHGIWSPIVDR